VFYHPLVILGLLIFFGLLLFILLVTGLDSLERFIIDHRWESISLTTVSVFMSYVGIKIRQEHWDIWGDETGYKVISRRRVLFNPKRHKISWSLREIWDLKIEMNQQIREAWVVMRHGYPDEIIWKEPNEES